MRATVVALCVSSMFGCAHLEALNQKPQQQGISYVYTEISEEDSESVGEDMAKLLASQLPAAKTTLYIEPSNTYLREVLVDELAAKGFGILEMKPTQGPAVSFQYSITPLDNGVLVRMRYQGKIASRYYGRQPDGSLVPSSKVAVREATK